MKIIVIIRNPAPLIFMQEPVSLRKVEIELTEEQSKKIELDHIGTEGEVKYYEEISQCFIEN